MFFSSGDIPERSRELWKCEYFDRTQGQPISKISLRRSVEHSIFRFQRRVENDGQHSEQYLS